MITVAWLVFGLLFASFLLIVLRGAPFVPTRLRDIDEIFALYNFKKGEMLVDLGSGDGRVLEAAAQRGVTSTGFELNPFLVLLARFRLRRHGDKALVHFADFWLTPLPQQTAVVFVFLAGPFMKKLDTKLRREAARLGHDVVLISYGVKQPDMKPEATKGGFLLYRYRA